MASSAKSKIPELDKKYFAACSQALSVVIVCTNLVDNRWHTAQAFYEDVKSRDGCGARGLEIDLDSLKRAMRSAPCLPWLRNNDYIAYTDLTDESKEAIIDGEFKRGRTMKVTCTHDLDVGKLTRQHVVTVQGLKNQLEMFCEQQFTISQAKKNTSRPKLGPKLLQKTPQKSTHGVTPQRPATRSVVTASSSKLRGVVAPTTEEQDLEEEEASEETEKAKFHEAYLIVLKALKKEVEDYASLRLPKKLKDDDYEGMEVDEEEEEEWEDSDTKFPFSKRLPLFQNLLTVLTSSPSFSKENKTAQNNVETWSNKQRDALQSLCDERKVEKEAKSRVRKVKKSCRSARQAQSSMLLRLTRLQRCEAVFKMCTQQLELAKEAVLHRQQQFVKKARLVELLLQQSDNVRRNGGPHPNKWATANGMQLFYGATRATHEHFSRAGLAICPTTAAKKSKLFT